MSHTKGELYIEYAGENEDLVYITTLGSDSGDIADLYHTQNGKHYQKTNDLANAKRIVHTWSCHDELVEALEEITTKHWDGKLNRAIAALAKAKGEV